MGVDENLDFTDSFKDYLCKTNLMEDIQKVALKIFEKNYKRILIQLPDGLKQYGNYIIHLISDELKRKYVNRESYPNVKFYIYFGDCFGACDLPLVNHTNFDLVIQFGHSSFKKESW